jgi:ribosomal protein L3 glutamine methyltransferase
MLNSYLESTQHFETILDFYRFGLSRAYEEDLYFGHGTVHVEDDIWWLILGSLSLPFTTETDFYSARLTTAEKQHLAVQLEKRIMHRIPVPYLIHQAQFCDLSFYVDERVLIPRSPVAELIRQQFSPWISAENVSTILDLCTGSGCIAIACAVAFPDALVDAVDISQDALDVAAINRENHGLEEQLTLIQSDCFDAVPKTRYDIIISNPPYVSAEEMQDLPEEYTHEPVLALEAAHSGLAIVEKILVSASDYLSENGILVVEVGNSEDALIDAYPHVPFIWLDFEHGGQGVFLLMAEDVRTYFGEADR